jgi:hypothetical protein
LLEWQERGIVKADRRKLILATLPLFDKEPFMTCQDVSFAHGRCQIEIEPPSDMGFPTCAARIFIVEDDGRLLRPLAFADGRRVEIRGSTGILALNSAVTYLSRHLGPRATPEFDCAPTCRADTDHRS